MKFCAQFCKLIVFPDMKLTPKKKSAIAAGITVQIWATRGGRLSLYFGRRNNPTPNKNDKDRTIAKLPNMNLQIRLPFCAFFSNRFNSSSLLCAVSRFLLRLSIRARVDLSLSVLNMSFSADSCWRIESISCALRTRSSSRPDSFAS